MTAWTGRAQVLAAAIREPGEGAAEANARAWSARCRPEATRGLAGAAMILTDGEAGAALWASAEPCRDDKTLLAWAEDIAGHVADLGRQCQRMMLACAGAFEEAGGSYAQAMAAARAAQARMAAAATPDAHCAAEADFEAALERARAAALVIADCEAALEVLGAADARLDAAHRALSKVPADLHDSYEEPYEFVRGGGLLPHDGDFLTGTPGLIKG